MKNEPKPVKPMTIFAYERKNHYTPNMVNRFKHRVDFPKLLVTPLAKGNQRYLYNEYELDAFCEKNGLTAKRKIPDANPKTKDLTTIFNYCKLKSFNSDKLYEAHKNNPNFPKHKHKQLIKVSTGGVRHEYYFDMKEMDAFVDTLNSRPSFDENSAKLLIRKSKLYKFERREDMPPPVTVRVHVEGRYENRVLLNGR